MKNTLSFLLIVLGFTFLNAQNISIKGKILDNETGLSVESATVYLSRIQDSTVVDYTISDKNGNFDLKIKKTDKPTRLRITNIIYQTYIKDFQTISDNIDLGEIKLDIHSTLIDSVVVNIDVPPIRIKNDTLEFNASSFKVRPDANVETLLKQLPGVEVSSDGKITVNGKQVNQILVNGKPFFDNDGKIALQNLPAEIINKVQVTDLKTKEQEISGEAATTDDLSINLTIDEDKNKGYFGRIMGGYGTDDRYESSGLVNYFKGDLRVSVLASSNNINASGFSMDEVFDNMNSIRNVNMSSTGGMSVNGINFGGMDKGITQSNVLGFNYADKWFEKADVNGSYFYSDSSNENLNKTRRVNLLPDDLFTTESETISKDDQSNHSFNFGFEIKIDSTSTLWISPSLSKTTSKSKTKSSQYSIDEFDDLLNESFSDVFSENDNLSFSNRLYYLKRLKRKGRNFAATFRNSNRDSETDSYTNSETYFYQSLQADDIRNQNRNQRGKNDTYNFILEYREPLTDSLSVKFTADYEIAKSSDINKTYDFDTTSQSYTDFNDLLSNSIWSETRTLNPNFQFDWKKSKYDLTLAAGSNIIDMDNSSLYFGNNTNLKRSYITPNYRGNLRYRMSKSKSLSLWYNYSENLPSAVQLLPVENLSNPLNTIIGNPDLDLNKNHRLSLGFNNYDYASRSGYSTWFSSNYYNSRVASVTTFDEDRKRTTTYTNIEDTYGFSLSLNWDKNYKTETGHKYGVSIRMWNRYDFNKGFTNAELFKANQLSLSPTIELNYEYGEFLTVYPSYTFTYNQTNYENYMIDKSSNFFHRAALETTTYYPENWIFGNDFGYNYNSNIADGFRKDFFTWNVSLSYKFWQDKFTAKVKVYDLLNQNTSNSRQISDIAIIDTEDIILQRYVMFSLSYKIANFTGKEKDGQRGRRSGGVRFFRM